MTETVDSKPTVLVVDDSRLMRVAARKILKDDFEILEAGDGEQAWESLQSHPNIDLVMSDLSMPNLDGLGLLKRIRESGEASIKMLPVIIVTGAEDDDDSRQTALAAGASDFITKPFESVQLLARAKAQARQQRTQQALVSSEASKQVLEQHNPVDLLTGLPNARGFANSVEESLSYARRHCGELALLLVRVEKYKILFLRYGKQTAEEILQRLAALVRDQRRREDVVARLELDTLAVLLPSANAAGARQIAEQLLERVREQDFSHDGAPLPVKVSIGVIEPPITAQTSAAELLAAVREKLQQASDAGGDCVGHDLVEPETPPAEDAKPMPIAAPAVATAKEIHEALQAIGAGRGPDTDIDALVRAVLPLLHTWNDARNGGCDSLLSALEKALDEPCRHDESRPAGTVQDFLR